MAKSMSELRADCKDRGYILPAHPTRELLERWIAESDAIRELGQMAEEAQRGDEPQPQPYALIDAETVMVPSYRPQVRVCVPGPDGESVEVVTCQHSRYGHETEDAALKCGARVARARGLSIGPR